MSPVIHAPDHFSNHSRIAGGPAGRPRNIAVIGSGIAGLSAAWLLSRAHKVTIYEQETRLGGHSHTVDVQFGETKVPVDTGFIVYNERSYPNLVALFAHLKVATKPSDMSFSVSLANGGFEYGSKVLNAVFGQARNVVRPRFWRMIADMRRFYQVAEDVLARPEPYADMSLGAFLQVHRFSSAFIDQYILPMGAAIWSTKPREMRAHPVTAFVRFFESHGLLGFRGRVPWRTVHGGSRAYVTRMVSTMGPAVTFADGARSIRRRPGSVTITDSRGDQHLHDAVVVATHGDQALDLLADPDPIEQRLLGAFRYTDNRVVLHSDASLMPKRKRVWSSWNYSGEADAGVSVTYWMNALQGIDPRYPLFVSVNPTREPGQVHREFCYEHPFFDAQAMAAQDALWQLQGRRQTWFCGSYFGSGFHEDALQSGLAAAEACGGVRRPWEVANESGRIRILPTPDKVAA